MVSWCFKLPHSFFIDMTESEPFRAQTLPYGKAGETCVMRFQRLSGSLLFLVLIVLDKQNLNDHQGHGYGYVDHGQSRLLDGNRVCLGIVVRLIDKEAAKFVHLFYCPVLG